VKVERELERLFAFEGSRAVFEQKLVRRGVDKQIADEIIGIITQEEEEKNKIAEDIRQTVAIYQGQATLGKIINVVLHEGRRPLNYFKKPDTKFEIIGMRSISKRETWKSYSNSYDSRRDWS